MRTEALDICISTVRNLYHGVYNRKAAPRFLENLCTPELVNELSYLYVNVNRVCTFVYEDLLRFSYFSGNV